MQLMSCSHMSDDGRQVSEPSETGPSLESAVDLEVSSQFQGQLASRL